MNKNLMIAVAVIIVLLLAVGGFMLLSKKSSQTSQTSSPKSTSANPISSIQDALTSGVSLECNITTSSGMKIAAHIKSGMIRSDVTGNTPQESGSMIMRDKKIYFWNQQGAFMMAMPNISVTPSQNQTTPNSAQSTLDSLEQYKQDCKPALVSDSLFALPTGIKFQDMSSMMSGAPRPSGTQTAPSGVPTQYQQMMQRYLTPTQ